MALLVISSVNKFDVENLLAIDIFPEGGFRDPHFLTRVLGENV